MADGQVVIDFLIDSEKAVRTTKQKLQELDKNFDKSFKGVSQKFNNAFKGLNLNKALDFDKISDGALKLGASMIPASLIAGKLTKDIFNAGKSFESAFAGVEKTVDEPREVLDKLRQGFLDLSTEIPITADELAKIGESAGQLGVSAEHILGFTDTMAKLGVATNLSSEEAATALARFKNITGMAESDYDRLGSTIVALGNNFATTESEIVEMAMRLAGAGKVVGLSETQIMGMSAALTSVGVNAEAGGTAFSKLMMNIQKAASEGGDKLESFAKVSGMSSKEFKKAWKADSGKTMTDIITGLGKMQEKGEDLIPVLKELGITDQRMIDAVLRSVGAYEMFGDAMDLANKAWEENTALSKEAEQRFKTIDSLLIILKNVVTKVFIAIFDAMKPTIIKILSSLSDFSKGIDDFLSKLDPSVLSAFGFALIGIAAIAPALLALGGSIKAVQMAAEGFQLLAAGLNPVVLIVLALVAAFTYLMATNESFRDTVVDVVKSVADKFKELQSALSPVFDSISDKFNGLITNIKNAVSDVDFKGIGDNLAKEFDGLDMQLIADGFKSSLSIIGDYLQNILSKIDLNVVISTFSNMANIASTALATIVSWVTNLTIALAQFVLSNRGAIEGIFKAAGSVVGSIINVMVSAFNMLTGVIKTVLPYFEMIGNIFINQVLPPMLSFAATVAEAVAPILETLSDIFGTIASIIQTVVMPAVTTLAEFFLTILAGAMNALTPIFNIVVSVLKIVVSVIGILINLFLSLINVVLSLAGFVLTGLVNAFSFVITIVGAVISAIFNIIGTVGMVLSSIIGFVANVISSFVSMGSKVVGSINGFISKVINSFSRLISSIGGAVNRIISAVVNGFTRMVSSAIAIAGRLVTAVTSPINKAVSAAKSAVSNFFSIGADMVNGIINGIAGNIGRVAETILGGIKGAVDSVKSFLGIKSPSRLMIKIFGYVVDGAVLGITKNNQKLVEAGKQSAMLLVNSIKKKLNNTQYETVLANNRLKRLRDKLAMIVSNPKLSKAEKEILKKKYDELIKEEEKQSKRLIEEAARKDKYNSKLSKLDKQKKDKDKKAKKKWTNADAKVDKKYASKKNKYEKQVAKLSDKVNSKSFKKLSKKQQAKIKEDLKIAKYNLKKVNDSIKKEKAANKKKYEGNYKKAVEANKKWLENQKAIAEQDYNMKEEDIKYKQELEDEYNEYLEEAQREREEMAQREAEARKNILANSNAEYEKLFSDSLKNMKLDPKINNNNRNFYGNVVVNVEPTGGNDEAIANNIKDDILDDLDKMFGRRW